MFAGRDHIIHELLRRRGELPPEALAAVWDEHCATGAPVARLLVDYGLIDRAALCRAVADFLGAGVAAGALPEALPADIVAQVPAAVARAEEVVPLGTENGVMQLAAADPFGESRAAALAFALNREIRLVVADPAEVGRLLQRHYGGVRSASASPGLKEIGERAAAMSEAELEDLAADSPLVGFVNGVLAGAIRERASDLHFEPFPEALRIRQRVDGALVELPAPPPALARPVISRLKVLGNLDIAERRRPQDGRIQLSLGGRPVDLRISTLPTQFGESVVLRILDQSAVRLALGELGLPAGVADGLRAVLARPHGLLAVTGPTGAGKTTTLYSCLQELNAPGRKLLTVEDPVEYDLDGVMQVGVNPAAGLSFAAALRAFLRQDPDIVMVGEIRDLETAQIAVQAALTGHFVLTTLHTNDAAATVTRLADMGVERHLLAATVEAVVAQRLVRRLCPACRTPWEPPRGALAEAGLAGVDGRGPWWQPGKGCESCGGRGYRGRLGVFELLVMNDELRHMVAQGAPVAELRQRAGEQGMPSLRDHGTELLAAGETSLEELARAC